MNTPNDIMTSAVATSGTPAPLELIPAKELAVLRETHGPIVAVRTKSGVFGFRVAKVQEYQQYTAYIHDEKKRPRAAELLTRTCVVYPGVDQAAALASFDVACRRYPGIVMTCANPLIEHCGFDTEAEVGKDD